MKLEFLGGARDGTRIWWPGVLGIVPEVFDDRAGERYVPVEVVRRRSGRVSRVVYRVVPRQRA